VIRLSVKVIPNASKTCIVSYVDGALVVKIQAPAQDGKANDMLLRFISKEFKVPRSRIKIVYGQKSREKILEIDANDLQKPLIYY
jgi:uncharacterized protein (TIGR00251 family)